MASHRLIDTHTDGIIGPCSSEFPSGHRWTVDSYDAGTARIVLI